MSELRWASKFSDSLETGFKFATSFKGTVVIAGAAEAMRGVDVEIVG